MTRQVVLDTETTGLSPANGDRLIEIGCIELLNRKPSGQHLHLYVNPQRPSDPGALAVHGLTEEFLADKPLFEHVADELLAFVADSELIIHNAPFDVGFLDAELARLGKSGIRDHVAGVTDSLALAKQMFPGKQNSLDALCRRFEVDNSRRTLHGALLDAGLLADVYVQMTRGQDSLVIDASTVGPANDGPRQDLSIYALAVLPPSIEELAEHEQVLSQIDKASSGKTVWRAVWGTAA
jgi:DNA polymerase III subunit epsilon